MELSSTAGLTELRRVRVLSYNPLTLDLDGLLPSAPHPMLHSGPTRTGTISSKFASGKLIMQASKSQSQSKGVSALYHPKDRHISSLPSRKALPLPSMRVPTKGIYFSAARVSELCIIDKKESQEECPYQFPQPCSSSKNTL